MSRHGYFVALAIAWLGLGCGSSDGIGPPPPPPPPPATPGAIEFDVATPPDLEHGGLLLTIQGGAVDSVTAAAGYEVFHTLTPTGAKAMIFGAIVNGRLVKVWVPDVSQAGRYSGRVDEGAVRGTYGVVAGDSYQMNRLP